jgi:hypothetical protein
MKNYQLQTVEVFSMKGIHVMVSAILLIAITLVAASIILNWIPTIFQGSQTNIESKTGSCSSAAVQIRNVYLDINGSVGRLSVFNSGLDDDSIRSVGIISNKGESSTNLSVLPVPLIKGDLKTMEVNISGKITGCSNFSRAFVTTSCGIQAEFGRFSEQPECVIS